MIDDRPRRAYRRLLRLAPRRLRDRHAAEMEEAFVAVWLQAQPSGRAARSFIWIHAAWDLLLARLVRSRPPHSLVADVTPRRQTNMIGSEVRSAIRSFRRQKLATSLVITMLALGIAANIVIFSLINGLFLRPFPFAEPDRLVYLNERAPRWNLDQTGVNFPDFDQWRKSSQAFESMAIFGGSSFNLSDDRGAERIDGAAVTHDFLKVLRLQPLRGRMFTPEEDRPDAARVVMLSERTWRERFGSDEAVLGKTLQLSGRSYEIVGVYPRQAEFPNRSAVWIPLAGNPNQQGQNYSYSGVGRLKPGITIALADEDLQRAQEPIWANRDKEKNVSPLVMPLRDNYVTNFRRIASALWISVAILLIVACANVAAVMLARAIARRREMGIRLAIGANRLRLLRQLFIENIVLAVIGGVIGVALGRWALKLLVSATDTTLPAWAPFDFDGRIVAFALLVTAVTSLLFGWAPALHAVRGDLRSAVTDTTSGSTVSPRGRRTLTWLVGAEFALASLLLVGGALLFRAFGQVQRVDPGYRADHALTFSVALPNATYADGQARMVFWNRLLDRLRATPGIEAAGIITCPPLTCHWGNFYTIEGRPPLKPGETNPVVLSRVASAGYFEAMGIRLRAGRFFNAEDGVAAMKAEAETAAAARAAAEAAKAAGATPPPAPPTPAADRSVIVNEVFVRTFWPGMSVADAVGKRISFNSNTPVWMNVVGVTGDVKHYGLERPMRPGLYFPAPQQAGRTSSMAVVVRTAGDPDSAEAMVRPIVREVDPSLPLYRVQTLDRMLADSLRTRATYSWMLAVFAGMALILALGGTYGVTSYLVSQRTREIGIRLAMGARSADILRAVLRSSLAAIALGVALGLTGAVVLGNVISRSESTTSMTDTTLLFGVSPLDPAVLVGAAAALAMAAVLANWIPARRAARTDPMLSLRT